MPFSLNIRLFLTLQAVSDTNRDGKLYKLVAAHTRHNLVILVMLMTNSILMLICQASFIVKLILIAIIASYNRDIMMTETATFHEQLLQTTFCKWSSSWLYELSGMKT